MIYDPRIDPDDPHDKEIVFKVGTMKSKLDIKVKFSQTSIADLKSSIVSNKTQMLGTIKQQNSLTLDLDMVRNVEIRHAFQGHESYYAPKCRHKMAYQDLPKQQKAVEERIRVNINELGKLRSVRLSRIKLIEKLKGEVSLIQPYETPADSAMRIRKLDSAICKMTSKQTSAFNIKNVYKRTIDELKQEELHAPMKMRVLELQIKKTEAEIRSMQEAKDEMSASVTEMRKQCDEMVENLRYNLRLRKRTIFHLKKKVDPIRNPQMFAADDPILLKAQREAAMTMKQHQSSKISRFESSKVLVRQERLVEVIRKLAEHRHVASKLEQFTKLPFGIPKNIGKWFCNQWGRRSKVAMKILDKTIRRKKRNRHILEELNKRFEKARFTSNEIIITLLEKAERHLAEVEKRTKSKELHLLHIMKIKHCIHEQCSKWINSFLDFPQFDISDHASPADEMEFAEAFVSAMNTIHVVAQKNINRMLRNVAEENSILLQGMERTSFRERVEFLAHLRAVRTRHEADMTTTAAASDESESLDEFGAVIVGDGVLALNDDLIRRKWVASMDDRRKIRTLSLMFMLAFEQHELKANENNFRVGTKISMKAAKDELEFYEPNDCDYKSAKVIKEEAKLIIPRKRY